MPDDRIKISDFGTPVSLNNDDVIVIVQNVGGVKTTYKAPLTLLATQLLKNMQFASDLQTTNKAIIGAINEVAQGGGGASALNDLTDVTITNPSNGQVITYNAQTGKWVNGAGAEITLVNTASGAIATFSDGAAGLPLKSLKVEIKPKQSSGTPTPSNPLPISGTDTVIITQTGKNLFNSSISSNINTSIKAWASNDTNIVAFLNTLKKGTYKVSYKIKVDAINGSGTDSYGIIFAPSSGAHINTRATESNVSVGSIFERNATITIGDDTTFANVWFYTGRSPATSADNCTFYDFQIEVGSTATTYEPYSATTKTVSLPQTVYGGEVDLIGGSGTSNYIITTIGNSGWNLYNNQYFYKTFDDKIIPSIGDTSNPVFCSVLPYGGSKYGSSFEDGYIYQSSTKNLYIKDSSCTDMTTFYAKYSSAQISYKLATPTQITLANPIDLTAKAGVNNVFGDTDGNTSVDYFNSIAGNVEELIDMLIPHDASELDYDNTSSGLAADDVQSAIDEVAESLGIMNTATLLWTGDMHGNGAQATIPNLSDWLIVGYSVDENEDFYISIGTAGRGGSNYIQYQGSNLQFIAHRFSVNGNTISATQEDQGIAFSGGTTYNDSASCHVRKVYGLLKKPTISNS